MNFQFLKFTKYRGQTLVELILVMGLAAIILPALLTGFVSSRNGKPQQQQRLQATTVLKESEAAVRNIRNNSWNSIAAIPLDTPYHTEISGSQWSLVSGSFKNSDGITQDVRLNEVRRDQTGAIVPSGGTVDTSTKKVTIAISWSQPSNTSISSDLYITNRKNLTQTQTTTTQFNAGTKVSTQVLASSPSPIPTPGDGQVSLDQSVGNADWCVPANSIVATLNLPKKGNSISAPAVGSAHIATGDGGAGESFVNVGITYPTPPASPVASVVASYVGNYQTNSIYSDGTYAYLAINGTTQQVRILKINTQPYTEVGTISVTGTNVNGVYVSGNDAYVTSGNKLYKVDVTNKTGSHSPVASKAMTADLFESGLTAMQVAVANNHVFVTVQGSLAGLQVYRTSDLKLMGLAKPSYKQVPRGLFVNSAGSRVYVAFSGGTGFFSKGFFIVNTYEPESFWVPILAFYLHSVVGSYNTTSMDPRGMSIAPGNSNRALIGGIGGEEYQVINIANESNPTRCGGLNIDAGVTGLAGGLDQYANAYSFLLTAETTDQFKMIKGGAGGGGGGYAASGTFVSAPIDAVTSAVFNRFVATVAKPVSTNIKMQVGVATPSGGSCVGDFYTYLGPDGTTSSYYLFNASSNTISGSIPIANSPASYKNPERCFSYKTYFENSASATPTLYDFTVNYSP